MTTPNFWAAIPLTWEVKRNRYVFRERNERGGDALPLAAVSQRYGVMDKRELEALEGRKLSAENEDLSKYKRIEPDDIVYNKMRMWQGAVGVSRLNALVSPAYVVAVPMTEIESRYMGYLLKSVPYVTQSGLSSYGICDDQNSLRWEDFADLKTPVPPLHEQTHIANFLDEQTVRIDALIAEKERLLAALEEWNSAQLARICFGTDRQTVKTANSWIPQLPVGWKVMRLKHLVLGIEQGWSPECEARLADDDEWGVLKAGAANGGRFRETEHKALPATLNPIPELEVRAGDVLITRASGSADLVGSFAYVYSTRPKLMLSDKNFRLRFSENPVMLPELLAWMCNTHAVREQVLQYVSGADGLAKNIGSGSLRELWLAVPPQHEQVGLVEKLRAIRHQLDSLREHLITHIDRLREYRSSLISAAVTGQLDINSYKEAA